MSKHPLSVTSCHDKGYGGKGEKLQKIMDVVESHPEGANAKQIVLESKEAYSTVRNYLRKLSGDGKVYQDYPRGLYKVVANTTYGVVATEPKIQNIRLGYNVPKSTKITYGKVVESIDNVKLHIEFGERHQYISAVVGAEPPLTRREFELIVKIFKLKVKERTGIEPIDTDTVVTSFELNQDYVGFRLDGMNCITVKDFSGFLEKIYNKNYDVRREVKISQPIRLESLYTLLTGGFKNHVFVQQSIHLSEKLERVEKDIDLVKDCQQQLIQLIKALLEKFDNVPHTVTRKVEKFESMRITESANPPDVQRVQQ